MDISKRQINQETSNLITKIRNEPKLWHFVTNKSAKKIEKFIVSEIPSIDSRGIDWEFVEWAFYLDI